MNAPGGELATLLIVDDEAGNIQVLAEALRGEYHIYFATSGEQALEMTTRRRIDLILLDVVMPGIDGFEVLRRLKDNVATRSIPVIFVTAMSDVEDETRGLAMGAVDYVSKPYRLPVVRARINTHLSMKRHRELLEQHAFIDGLTEVGNRRLFDDALPRRWRAALRSGQAMSLVLLDIDHFKAYNDNYGHAVGDRCLKTFARRLAACFNRADDVVARYGGEEFAIIPALDADADFTACLQRLLDALHTLAIPHGYSPTADRVTASAGAIRFRPQSDPDPERLVKAADELLYRAKRMGRNACSYRDETAGRDGVLRPAALGA